MNTPALVLCVLLCTGCSSTALQFYQGNPRPSNETATISLWSNGKALASTLSPADLHIQAVKINDQPILASSDISVLPGHYQVEVECTVQNVHQRQQFAIDAVAMQNYAIIAIGEQQTCHFDALQQVVNGRFVDVKTH